MARARHSRELPVAHKLCQAATSACAICHLCMYLVAHKLCHLYMGHVPPQYVLPLYVPPLHVSGFTQVVPKVPPLHGPSCTQIAPHMISTLFTWHRLWLSQVRMCCKNIYIGVNRRKFQAAFDIIIIIRSCSSVKCTNCAWKQPRQHHQVPLCGCNCFVHSFCIRPLLLAFAILLQ